MTTTSSSTKVATSLRLSDGREATAHVSRSVTLSRDLETVENRRVDSISLEISASVEHAKPPILLRLGPEAWSGLIDLLVAARDDAEATTVVEPEAEKERV